MSFLIFGVFPRLNKFQASLLSLKVFLTDKIMFELSHSQSISGLESQTIFFISRVDSEVQVHFLSDLFFSLIAPA
jgi:hypothetical protein